jgi:methylated-DNA-[protein]-cysteine S-methyltransferase
VTAAIWQGPLGRFSITVAADWVTGIERLPPGPGQMPQDPLAAEVVRQLEAWAVDPGHRFDLPLAPAPTPFQQRFRAALCAVPAGTVVTYGELAACLRSGARAVGAACGANPLPLVVPCHRVVAAAGVGGYGRERTAGEAVAFKRRLLAREGVVIA